MQDIIIDGISLNSLKIRQAALDKEKAEIQSSIKQGASKFIAETIVSATASISQLLDAESEAEVVQFSQAAYEYLKNARFVADVSGVGYTIPYYDRQSEYSPEGKRFSCQIDESDNEFMFNAGKEFSDLLGLLEDMESEVADWNQSFC